jgi:hypothetical protein
MREIIEAGGGAVTMRVSDLATDTKIWEGVSCASSASGAAPGRMETRLRVSDT